MEQEEYSCCYLYDADKRIELSRMEEGIEEEAYRIIWLPEFRGNEGMANSLVHSWSHETNRKQESRKCRNVLQGGNALHSSMESIDSFFQ
jgi:endonuclease/exonuclease/phosphatase family metal-dependent hydrolase